MDERETKAELERLFKEKQSAAIERLEQLVSQMAQEQFDWFTSVKVTMTDEYLDLDFPGAPYGDNRDFQAEFLTNWTIEILNAALRQRFQK